MIITPTINFTGNCEDAIHLYERAFNTKVDFVLRYSDADAKDWNIPLTDKEKNFVYHAEMKIAGQRFFFADIINFEVVKGNSQFLTVTFGTKEEVEKSSKLLMDGGKILVPFRRTTYSSCAGNLIDKYGIRWGLMTEQTEK
ncbi:MAG: VOC family protein [Treponema sp.]|jgi:PhnB protein|nr:VOC family protein [Treponema sp.]